MVAQVRGAKFVLNKRRRLIEYYPVRYIPGSARDGIIAGGAVRDLAEWVGMTEDQYLDALPIKRRRIFPKD